MEPPDEIEFPLFPPPPSSSPSPAAPAPAPAFPPPLRERSFGEEEEEEEEETMRATRRLAMGVTTRDFDADEFENVKEE